MDGIEEELGLGDRAQNRTRKATEGNAAFRLQRRKAVLLVGHTAEVEGVVDPGRL